MKIIKQSWEFLEEPDGEKILKQIELAGRTCYKSEEKITPDSSKEFVKKIIKNQHLAMIEHGSISIKMITDRGVTHEIVRHRVASYAQESTRYCNYSKDKFDNQLTMILPVWFYDIYSNNEEGLEYNKNRGQQYIQWKASCEESEETYLQLLYLGQTPQEARSILPNSLKTELVMTANIREWRHFFTLRCSSAAHPQMRSLAKSMLSGFLEKVPVLFDDLGYDFLVST